MQSQAKKTIMFAGTSGSISPTACAMTSVATVYAPECSEELDSAVLVYLAAFPKGDGSHKEYGRIGEWDVSRVIDMAGTFSNAILFNGDISKWDVSRVEDMSAMFWGASSFNGDLSKWDVSRVKYMDQMFYGAPAFTHSLCTPAWVHSRASKDEMFVGSPGSISKRVCAHAITPEVAAVSSQLSPQASDGPFSPRSREELKTAVDSYLRVNGRGDAFGGEHGPIGEWDVSRVIDMAGMFSNAVFFNGDISKWDVSRVLDMSEMFWGASSFNVDLSRWDVSGVTDMDEMFEGAAAFTHTLCSAAWVNSKASKKFMFEG